MFFRKGGAFAEAGHIGAQVVHPHILRAVFVVEFVFGGAFGKNNTLVLTPGRKNTRGQAQNGVQITLVH